MIQNPGMVAGILEDIQYGSSSMPVKQASPKPNPVKEAPSASKENSATSGIGGIGNSIDVTLALGPFGISLELGYIVTSSGSETYFSFGKAVGFEASAGVNLLLIPSSDFKISDFQGQSATLNGNFYLMSLSGTSDYSRGGINDYYLNNYGGVKIGFGAGVGGSFSHTTTTFFNLPNIPPAENIWGLGKR